MSFITKRERVFNEYELYDLPSRNEGKLKAFSSCTDARAWSHFCSDKSEHLVDIIKRNNETCRPKLVPTEVIVNTLMSSKNAEIARLKRKIEEFEQMLAAYDELELTCEQKCEIAAAHTAIKEANKELNELWFDLDMSGFTGIDSEGFETGKSRGDEVSRYRDDDQDNSSVKETPRSKGDELSYQPPQKESKSNQVRPLEMDCICDASTNATDPRIEELQDTIVSKDAKLNAMHNTIAVMENDVCEPYCIYAHIYTALEKIFGVLCQNDKYKLYLNLMTAGKDTRCIDIKGKILYKLKVFEKFSMALIAPCSQELGHRSDSEPDCSCFRAEIVSRIETTYALTSAETQLPSVDNKRAQLVAEIMQHEEMKEILSKESTPLKTDLNLDDVEVESYHADDENLKRLINLQENYDDLMNCYEGLKHEKDCLQIRSQKYEELEKEVESLKSQLREYNSLWNEKEHYRKRSDDLDLLKEQYLVLYDETTNLETQLKADSEIISVKVKTIEELRSENILLEEKLNEASMSFDKEKSSVQCKIKECECTIMCQKQQIKSLSVQIDRLLEQEPDTGQSKSEVRTPAIDLMDEINSLKEQITNLKDALYCNEEEKEQLQEEYRIKLNLINDLKMEVEDWKNSYEKVIQRNEYLEKYTESFQKLVNDNEILLEDNKAKTAALENLREVIYRKSQEVQKLMEDVDNKNEENSSLCKEINSLHEEYIKNITALDSEKCKELQLAKQESHELLEKVKNYDELIKKKESLTRSLHSQNEELIQLQSSLINTREENKNLRSNLANHEKINLSLLQENKKWQDLNNVTFDNINSLKEEKNHYKMSLELTKKDSKILQEKLDRFEDLSQQLEQYKKSLEEITKEKNSLENELAAKTVELTTAVDTIQLTRKASVDLENKLKETNDLNSEYKKIDEAYKKLMKDQKQLQSELRQNKISYENLQKAFDDLKIGNDRKSVEVETLSNQLESLKSSYRALLVEKQDLKTDYDSKNDEINNLYNTLESKIEENRGLCQSIRRLQNIEEDNFTTKNTLYALKKESKELMFKVKYCDTLQSEYNELKKEHDIILAENNELHRELKRMEKDNNELNSESQILLSHSEDLEKALISARSQLISTSGPKDSHHDIIEEIKQLKMEKLQQHERIRELRDKLETSENTMSDLYESLQSRDHKIANLQNHINDLQDEVKRLHISLSKVVDAGEQIRDNSYQKIYESLESMEAHHSKASHNMKIELAKLQNENVLLEERLSISKIKSEDSIRDKHKYISQIIHLQNEREIIVTDIKQLEMKSVGDSALSPDSCETEHILASLDRIRRYIDDRSSKTMLLKQSLFKVQNSYQLVQDKADEAKKIVEKEKQKILNEKEEAIKDRASLEKQLLDFKQQLEIQVNHDKSVIKDLEAEILNYKLIIDKVNKSAQNYISKLEDEMQSLKELYRGALEKTSELETKLQAMTDENNNNLNLIEKVNKQLTEKCEDVDRLQKDLTSIKNKTQHSTSIQTSIIVEYKNIETQTDVEHFVRYDENKMQNNDIDYNTKVMIHKKKRDDYEAKKVPLDQFKPVNEVQVLTANVEPAFNFDRNSYKNIKLQQLSTGRMEQLSISNQSDYNLENENINIVETTSQGSEHNVNVIDIYNKYSLDTNSSKVVDTNNYTADETYPNKINDLTVLHVPTESFIIKNIAQQKSSNLLKSESAKSGDKNIFVIYKDSDSNYTNTSHDKKSWQINSKSVIDNDRNDEQEISKISKNTSEPDSDPLLYLEDLEDDSVKHKLNINMPRVNAVSPTISESDADKKSINSYSVAYEAETNKNVKSQEENYKSQSVDLIVNDNLEPYTKDEETRNHNKSDNTDKIDFIDPFHSIPANNNLSLNTSSSTVNVNEKLGESLLQKSRIATLPSKKINKMKKMKKEHLELDFIIDTGVVDTDNIKTFNALQELRQTRSAQFMDNIIKIHNRSDSSPSRLSPNKKQSYIEYKEVSSGSTDKSHSKTTIEGYVMVKENTLEEYENKIKELTMYMENIERDYKKKVEVIKIQYDNYIKNILNEHNNGVKSIQSLHEDTLHDIMKHHENEVENLRSMSIDAMKKAEKLDKENRNLLSIMQISGLHEEPIKISSPEVKRRRRSRIDTKLLSKTNVEAFNVRPKSQSNGPCTCTLDINLSNTIRNIFEQVDVEQRKMAEHTYLKHIANKILNSDVEALDCQELSFLHLKVCRIWKAKFSKEEALQKRINSLEAELMNKQRHTQQNMADLDRKVVEERRRLQEVREAVCRNVPIASRYESPTPGGSYEPPRHSVTTADKDYVISCNYDLSERRSAGDLAPASSVGMRGKKGKTDNRAVLAKLDHEDRREKKLYGDEPPTRLRRPHDRPPPRTNKK